MRPTLAQLENPTTLIHASVTAKDVTADVLAPIFRPPSVGYLGGLFVSMCIMGMMFATFTIQMCEGLGILGLNNPVMWGSYITNFVRSEETRLNSSHQ